MAVDQLSPMAVSPEASRAEYLIEVNQPIDMDRLLDLVEQATASPRESITG